MARGCKEIQEVKVWRQEANIYNKDERAFVVKEA
jgi:hypothetical protein